MATDKKAVRKIVARVSGASSDVAEIEKALLLSALQQAGGVQTKASDLLKISYRSFRHLAKKYDL